MRYLVDGYNLMHAKGLLPPGTKGPAFAHARTRFLNELRNRLGPVDAARTTVVFDARVAIPDRPARTRHRDIEVVFAVEEGDADSRLEALIAREATPKRLTVVSSDHRIRAAARRRGANTIDADAFWSRKPAGLAPTPPRAASDEPARDPIRGVSAAERAEWLEAFCGEEERELAESAGSAGFAPSEAEILRIAEEVSRESLTGSARHRRKRS
jgi:predicted RNA-binding protein with PIN domain